MPTDKRTVTPRRRAANRAAAAQSTGPRTEEGKARSAQNSLRHGAFAQQPVIRHKALDRLGATARYEQLRESLASGWCPATPQQQELVDSLAWLTFLSEEARQAARREADALEEAQGRTLFPLSEEMAELLRQLEQLEKQINAKIRLLLRLEQRAEAVARGSRSNPAASPESRNVRQRTLRYKVQADDAPSQPATEPVARTSAVEVRGLSPNGATSRGPQDRCSALPPQNNGTKPTEPLESADVEEQMRQALARARVIYGLDKAERVETAPVAAGDEPCEL